VSIYDRLVDADVLWTAGRREGALFSTLVAINAIGRRKYPELGDGEAFRRCFTDQYSAGREIEHRGQFLTVGQLMWKWIRCEIAHQGSMPVHVQFFEMDEDPDDLRIQFDGQNIRISDGWYWLMRRIAVDSS
jgi:hypothetical protein